MGYWLKSFNKEPAPVPGKHYTVEQINLCACGTARGAGATISRELTGFLSVPLPTTAIFVVVALAFSWISDGPLKVS